MEMISTIWSQMFVSETAERTKHILHFGNGDSSHSHSFVHVFPQYTQYSFQIQTKVRARQLESLHQT